MENVTEPFLQRVANDLITRCGNDLSHVTVVLPNRRARLFFDKYLIAHAKNKPVWAPQYADFDTLFAEATALQPADPIELVARLYRSYRKHYHNTYGTEPETFDKFYFFGELLLHDFDDVDKYRVDAKALFRNMADIEEMGQMNYLTDEQKMLVKTFFHFDITDKSQLQQNFFKVWNILFDVYTDFKDELNAAQLGYAGMIARTAVEHIEQEQANNLFTQDTYVFVGFNILTRCEHALMKALQHKALFYWDCDPYFRNNTQEAGRYIRQNIYDFKKESPFEQDNSAQESNYTTSRKTITIVEAPGVTAQTLYLPEWIKTLNKDDFTEPDTAVVLCDEHLLQSALNAIPSEVQAVNVTMGFPVAQTPVADFVLLMTELLQRGCTANGFRYDCVLPLLHHSFAPYFFEENPDEIAKKITKNHIFIPTADDLGHSVLFQKCDTVPDIAAYLQKNIEILAHKLTKPEQNNPKAQLLAEAVFRVYQLLTRLNDLVGIRQISVEASVFFRLLKRLLGQLSVPYHGEPAQGLQLMGVMETRNLDFSNVLLLSLNEGTLPRTTDQHSFIPNFVRRAFNMSCTEHLDSLYAYQFYHILQRASRIALVYNTAKQQGANSEASRFVLQLLAEHPQNITIERKTLQPVSEDVGVVPVHAEIPKTPTMVQALLKRYNQLKNGRTEQALSPSAFNNYIDCSMRFYYAYVLNLKTHDELTDDMDNAQIGTIFHRTAELIYRHIGKQTAEGDFKPFRVTKPALEALWKKGQKDDNTAEVDMFLQQAFDETLFGHKPNNALQAMHTPLAQYTGKQLVYFHVIQRFVKQLLESDAEYAPFDIVGLEKEVQQPITINGRTLYIGGTIDRIDRKNGRLRVLDYKTSTKAEECKNGIETLFQSGKDRAKYILQILLYAKLWSQKCNEVVQPAILYIQLTARDAAYTPDVKIQNITVENYTAVHAAFDKHLEAKISELLNPEVPFKCAEKDDVCTYCDFKILCGRQKTTNR